ncbi:type VII secretion protein EccB [Rugosimonospora africana]|uniref:type VII secretion protein EccB n=1 Tax=Rugosimonospora africana TaxID=556532 RepID=UPI001945044E|nr:type VII secretion protein EccB [Rugosimonospora africana]
MASRTDQLHSYQFTAQRVVSALVTGQTDPAQSPFSRLAGSTFIGVLVAALSLAAVAVYGVLAPGGGTGWRDPSAVIVEKETGARYVYLDGVLRPVPNYTSALLVIGSADAHTVSVARRSIERVRRGAPLGIAGAPDSLPEAGRLLGAPWTMCSDAAGASALSIGQAVPGGRPLGDAGVLVRAAGDPAGGISLVWRGHRHQVTDFALGALAWRGQPVLSVAAALLNAVPAGPDLGAVPIAGRGRPSRAGFTVGQVFVVRPQGGVPQYAVAVSDGLAAISQVQANLLLGDRQTAAVQGRSGAIELSPGDYTAAPVSAPLTPRADELAPPLSMPALTQPSNVDSGLCVRTDGVQRLPSVRLDVPAGPVTGANGALAARVVVPPGRGTIVEAMPSPDAPSGALSLVTDLGVRYPVPRADVLNILGYAGVSPVRMPSGLVAALPTGPALDPDAARTTAAVALTPF